MLPLFTLLMVAFVTYAFLSEGILTAFATLVNVMLAGLVAFNYFEPAASVMEGWFYNTFLQGYEDCFAMVGIFSVVLALLRSIVTQLAPDNLEFHSRINQVGAGIFGAITGYLAAGFLMCAFQTIPFTENFGGFQHRLDPEDPGESLRRLVPPDRVWLALMHRAGKGPFAVEGSPTFDADGSFELRYAKERRAR